MVTVDRIVHGLSRFLMVLGVIALMLMMIQTVADVVARNVFRKPIEGSLEIVSVYHMVAVVFLPLALVERRHEHITVDLLVQSLPHALRRVVTVFAYLVCAVFFAVLSYQTMIDALEAYRIGEILMSSIYITVWPAKFLLPVGFAAMFMQVLLHVWLALTQSDFDPSPASPDAAAEARN